MRFVALIVGGWVSARVLLLWPAAGPPALIAALAPPLAAAPLRFAPQPRASQAVVRVLKAAPEAPADTGARPAPSTIVALHDRPEQNVATRSVIAAAEPERAPYGPIGAPISLASARPSRFAASAWSIVRGAGTAAPFAPQLGGSQAGGRLTYALDDAGRVALAARFSSALGSRQREAAVGIDWQPTNLPIHFVAEQRIGIEQARGGPSLAVIGGLAPTPIAAGFRLDAYGQAGVIARGGGVEGYADGAARIARPMASAGRASLDLGLGAWGGAQRGAARLDLGPSAAVTVPVAGRAVRVALDWRQRVAGNAQPGSGLALSLGADF